MAGVSYLALGPTPPVPGFRSHPGLGHRHQGDAGPADVGLEHALVRVELVVVEETLARKNVWADTVWNRPSSALFVARLESSDRFSTAVRSSCRESLTTSARDGTRLRLAIKLANAGAGPWTDRSRCPELK